MVAPTITKTPLQNTSMSPNDLVAINGVSPAIRPFWREPPTSLRDPSSSPPVRRILRGPRHDGTPEIWLPGWGWRGAWW